MLRQSAAATCVDNISTCRSLGGFAERAAFQSRCLDGFASLAGRAAKIILTTECFGDLLAKICINKIALAAACRREDYGDGTRCGGAGRIMQQHPTQLSVHPQAAPCSSTLCNSEPRPAAAPCNSTLQHAPCLGLQQHPQQHLAKAPGSESHTPLLYLTYSFQLSGVKRENKPSSRVALFVDW